MTEAETRERAGNAAIAILSAIVEMSDRAEKLGGARSIAGVAALNTLQASIQKNAPRMAQIAGLLQREGAR